MRRITPKLVAALLLAAVVVLLFPLEQTIAPDWQVTVVDNKGARLPGVNVRETWQHLSVEAKPHEELLQTDANGTVHFPRRTLNSNMLRRALGCWDQRRKAASPAPCGPVASVWAFGPELGPMDAEDTKETEAQYIRRELQPDLVVEQQTSMIMLHHCPAGHFGKGCATQDYAPTLYPQNSPQNPARNAANVQHTQSAFRDLVGSCRCTVSNLRVGRVAPFNERSIVKGGFITEEFGNKI